MKINYLIYAVLTVILLAGIISFFTGKIPVVLGCIQALAIFFGALIFESRNNAR